MSRIHEALKKAEEERATAQAGTAPAEPLRVVREERPVFRREEPPVAAAIAAEEVPAPLSLELILTRGPKPMWQAGSKELLLLNSQNHVAGSEELRTLRSRLYQLRDRQPLRTVLITSALPAEGKTFLAANLAQMIVRQHDRRALLIDADLRRPQLHAALGAPSAPGLSDYLAGKADELAVIQRGPKDNLFLIPGGTLVTNPAELLAGGRMKRLLEQVSPIFDWVLIDSPPAIPVADASMLADLCDGVLLVVRAASTPFDMAQRARHEFRDKRLLGVVLNRVEEREGYHSYYYYSHYGHGAKAGKTKR